MILSLCPVGDTGIFLPISAVDEFSHRSSREFRCLSKAIKPEIFNTDMFLFLLEKSPRLFNSPLSNGHSFYWQKGSLPLKAAFFGKSTCPLHWLPLLSSELWSLSFHPGAGTDSSVVSPAQGVCLEHIVPYPGAAGLSLSKHPWSTQGRASQPASLLTGPVNDGLPAYDRTGMFHIPAFDADWTSAERHGVFRHGAEGTLQASKQTQKATRLFNKLEEGKP